MKTADWLDHAVEHIRMYGKGPTHLSAWVGKDPTGHHCAIICWTCRLREVEVCFDHAVPWFYLARTDRGTDGSNFAEPRRFVKRDGLEAIRRALAWLEEGLPADQIPFGGQEGTGDAAQGEC
jgi:hypothetical protein